MSKVTNNTTIIKQINTELIKSTLKLLKHATKPLLANETGLSLATCNTILNELLLTGEVIAVELEASNGGRPATRFMYNADSSYIAYIYKKAEGGFNFDFKKTFKQMRISHLFEGNEKINIGLYACSPCASSFNAVFSEITVSDCLWKEHKNS